MSIEDAWMKWFNKGDYSHYHMRINDILSRINMPPMKDQDYYVGDNKAFNRIGAVLVMIELLSDRIDELEKRVKEHEY